MEATKATISVQVLAELINLANDGKKLKRLLQEKKRTFGGLDYSEVETLCIMFDLIDEGESV